MTDKPCEQCGTALNPHTTFDKCDFCQTGMKRPVYDTQAMKDLCQEDE